MEKKNLILGGALILLVVFAYFYQGPLKEWRENLGKDKNFLSAVSFLKIEKIEITKGEEAISLEKKNGKWKVGGTKDFYTSEQIAENLNFVLEKMAVSEIELAGDNADKKSDFKTDENGIGVKIVQAEKEFEFVVGKNTLDFSGSYIRQTGSDKTYKIGVNLSVFEQAEWRDKQIFSFAPEAVNKLRFQYPNRQFWMEKVDGEWKGILPWPFVVSEEKIVEILEAMGSLKAVEIPSQDFAGTGLEKNLIIVQVLGEEVDQTIMVGEADEDGLYFAKRADSDNIYLVSKEDRDVFDRTTAGLK